MNIINKNVVPPVSWTQPRNNCQYITQIPLFQCTNRNRDTDHKKKKEKDNQASIATVSSTISRVSLTKYFLFSV